MNNDDKTTDSRLEELQERLNYLESTPTADMLRDLSGGKDPLEVNLQLAERLVDIHDIPIGVINVLFQYVHIRNDGKITNNYVERIASHWMNKKVTTAKVALEVARDEYSQYKKWKKDGQQPVKEVSNNKVIEARQKAIEKAVYDSSMSDEQLGKFVRKMFQVE